MVAIFLSILIIFISIIGFIFSRNTRTRFIWMTNFWWSGLIILNRIKLSELQLEWSLQEQVLVSLVLFIPSVLCNIFISMAPKVKDSFLRQSLHDYKNNFEYENRKVVSSCQKILLLGFSILILDLFLNGVPLFSAGQGEKIVNEVRLAVRIPVVYSIAHQLVLVGLIGLALCKSSGGKKIKIYLLAFFLGYVIHAVLMVSRGTLSYAVVAIFLSYLFASPSALITKSRKLIIPFVVFMIAFAVAGVLRQSDPSSQSFSIIEYGLFPEWLPNTIAWFYGYVVIGIDNLIMCVRDFNLVGEFRGKSIQNFSPAFYNMVFLDSTDLKDITLTQTMPYVGKFNLVTAFGFFAFDTGWLGVYSFSMFSYLLIPALFRARLKNMSVLRKIMFIYIIMSFLFISVGGFLFNSRVIGFILGLLALHLMMKVGGKRYRVTPYTLQKED